MQVIIKILKSRFTKPKKSKEEELKKKVCKKCAYNSLNIEKVAFKKKLLVKLSDLLSYITNSKEDDVLGNCTACDGCSIYYKIIAEDECKHPKGNQWKI